VSGTAVREAAEHAGAETVWVDARGDLPSAVARLVHDGDVVLTMGAGDVTGVGPELLALLAGQAA
jgi:UDP-N-acetylmuramate--alanine ligase